MPETKITTELSDATLRYLMRVFAYKMGRTLVGRSENFVKDQFSKWIPLHLEELAHNNAKALDNQEQARTFKLFGELVNQHGYTVEDARKRLGIAANGTAMTITHIAPK